MTTRDHAPTGAPCWADLWTSDVAAAREFYSQLFGWEAQEPSLEFGGYFMFTRDGVPIAGGMGDMKATNSWRVYLATDNIEQVAETTRACGGTVFLGPDPVADLGVDAVLGDPTGAGFGAWQADTFAGFRVLDEPGTPSWFELHTSDFAGALAFYHDVFEWTTELVSDTDEFRYAMMQNPQGGMGLAGVMDASSFLDAPQSSHWSIYWEVADVDASIETALALGASVVFGPNDTPYGRLVELADPTGTSFKLRTSPPSH